MTIEEAIYTLRGLFIPCASDGNKWGCDRNEALDMAIEALSADTVSRDVYDKRTKADEEIIDSYRQEFQKTLSADAEQGWIPLSHDDDGLGTDFPYDRDGEWVIVTDGNTISVERIKKDAYDHFFPNGRWFGLEDVVAWMPLPKPYGERREE